MNDQKVDDHEIWIQSLVDEQAGPLTRYATSMTGDPDLARDAVQDTFLRLCREDQGKIENHAVPWLFRVCRSRVLDRVRKESRMRPLDTVMLATKPSRERSPATRAETSEACTMVMRLLTTLPERQQEIVRLKFQNGMSYKEIAEVTELSVGNVGFLLHTAMNTLREKTRRNTDLFDNNNTLSNS